MIKKTEYQSFIDSVGNLDVLNDLIGSMPDVHYVINDRKGRFVLVDEHFMEIFDCGSLEEVIGKTDYDFFPKDIAEGYASDDEEVMSSGKPLLNRTEIIPESDLFLQWWTTNKYPVHDKKGKVIGVSAISSKLSKTSMPAIENPEMHEVVAYIAKNYESKLKLKDLADCAKMTERSFIRHFRRSFECSPLKYVIRVRINAACRDLVRTNHTLIEIATDSGFSDQSHMTKEFKSKLNMTPLQYRKRHQVSLKGG